MSPGARRRRWDSAWCGPSSWPRTAPSDELPFDLVEPIIDVVRKASEAEVAMVVKEDDIGDLRVSLRSKGVADVSAVALGLGGGGHRLRRRVHRRLP